MKKAVKFTYLLALYIVGLFTLAMFMTYFSEWLQASGFFGDAIKTAPDNCILCTDDMVDKPHAWGARHYWYFWMCVFLFLLSLARIVIWAAHYWKEELKDSL